jgi:hypothetical protein
MFGTKHAIALLGLMDRDKANAERALVVMTISTATPVAVFSLLLASM